MDSTIVAAGLGFVAALLSVWLTARLQERSSRDALILGSRIRVYGDCSDSLFEYSRATYDRVKSRLENDSEPGEGDESDSERDRARQEAYRWNAKARSAIGQVHILTGDPELEASLTRVRRDIGGLNRVASRDELRNSQDEVYSRLKLALDQTRRHLV